MEKRTCWRGSADRWRKPWASGKHKTLGGGGGLPCSSGESLSNLASGSQRSPNCLGALGPWWARLENEESLLGGGGLERGSLGDPRGPRSDRTSTLAGPLGTVHLSCFFNFFIFSCPPHRCLVNWKPGPEESRPSRIQAWLPLPPRPCPFPDPASSGLSPLLFSPASKPSVPTPSPHVCISGAFWSWQEMPRPALWKYPFFEPASSV